MKIRKEVKLNENVYTLYNILEILYHHYLSTDMPKELLEEIKRVYDKFYDEVVKDYIKNHFEDVKKYANVIEHRIDDDCTMDSVLEDNAKTLKLAKKHGINYVLIDGEYKIEF